MPAVAQSAGLIGGKTGTSFRFDRSGRRIYCASFVGFAPLAEPRWLALAVIQKSSTHKFYGGMYSAPAVRDLLLEALGGATGSRPDSPSLVAAATGLLSLVGAWWSAVRQVRRIDVH